MNIAEIVAVEPLARLMADPEVTEIMINGPNKVFIERAGVREETGLRFEGEHRLRYAIERLLEANPGARVDTSSPMVDLALPDGSRVNVCIPPVVHGGPHLTIRKFNRPVKVPGDLVRVGTMDERMAFFMGEAVRTGAAVLYSGATGTGKTTMLECLASRIDPIERIIVIEDTLELHFSQPNVVRMVGRAKNVEGRGEITLGRLFRNTLRMRPKRIILGEIRGDEVMDYLQAINSGHRGSQAVIHSSNPREAVLRMAQLAMMSGRGADRNAVAQQVVQGLDLIVQIDQHPDGVRRTTAITEIVGDEAAPDGIALFDIFRWVPEMLEGDRVKGSYLATGRVPAFVRQMELAGVVFPDDLFAADFPPDMALPEAR